MRDSFQIGVHKPEAEAGADFALRSVATGKLSSVHSSEGYQCVCFSCHRQAKEHGRTKPGKVDEMAAARLSVSCSEVFTGQQQHRPRQYNTTELDQPDQDTERVRGRKSAGLLPNCN